MGYAATILAEASLLHYWKLQEATGATSYYDEVTSGKVSGLSYNAPLTGGLLGREHDDVNAVQLTRGGQKAIKFPLSTTIQGAWAFECICRVDANPATGAGGYIFGGRVGATSNISEATFDRYDGTGTPGVRVNIGDGSTWRYSPPGNTRTVPFVLGDWHHLVVTADSTSCSIIYDGVETVLAYTAGGAGPYFAHSTGGLILGNYNYASYDSNWAPDATFQHVAVYNARMSQAKAAAHYAQIGSAPVRAGAPGSYDMTRSGILIPTERRDILSAVHNPRPLYLPDTDFLQAGGGGGPRPDVGQVFPRGHS